MSVLKYDTVNSAYKDVQAMQRYDPSANAWKECTSAKVQENGVWVEKLNQKRYYVIKDGVDQGIVGGWTMKKVVGTTSYAWNQNGYLMVSNSFGAGSGNFYCSNGGIDKSKYKNLYVTAYASNNIDEAQSSLWLADSNQPYTSPYTAWSKAIIARGDLFQKSLQTFVIDLTKLSATKIFILINVGVDNNTINSYIKDLWLE